MMGICVFAGWIWMNKMAVCGMRCNEVNAKLQPVSSRSCSLVEIEISAISAAERDLPRKRGKPLPFGAVPTFQRDETRGSHWTATMSFHHLVDEQLGDHTKEANSLIPDQQT